jgi:hypothetical protein
MGCDIHAYIEVRIGERWVCHSQPRIKRAYGVFGKIAGIHDCGPPIVEPRGFPVDASEIARIEFNQMRVDAHHAGWLTADEVSLFLAWLSKEEGFDFCSKWQHEQLGYITGNSPQHLPGDGYPTQYEAMRLVFWFDN